MLGFFREGAMILWWVFTGEERGQGEEKEKVLGCTQWEMGSCKEQRVRWVMTGQ